MGEINQWHSLPWLRAEVLRLREALEAQECACDMAPEFGRDKCLRCEVLEMASKPSVTTGQTLQEKQND